MRVVVTDEAERDLERIADFIAQDNPGRAATFVMELVECCHQLADVPRGFPLVPRYAHTGLRRRIFGNYLIFYRLAEDAGRIDVVHILNGAQDYESLLFSRKP